MTELRSVIFFVVNVINLIAWKLLALLPKFDFICINTGVFLDEAIRLAIITSVSISVALSDKKAQAARNLAILAKNVMSIDRLIDIDQLRFEY